MRSLRHLIVAGSIFISWVILVYVLWLMNIILLVPWDVAVTRPDVGTWQRTLNDFFEGRFGENILLLTVVAMTAVPILVTLFRRWYSGTKIVALSLIVALVTYVLVMLSFLPINVLLPTGQDISDPFSQNYTRSLIPLIITWAGYAIWARLVIRAGFAEKQKNKRKHSDRVVSTERLELHSSLEKTIRQESTTTQHVALKH